MKPPFLAGALALVFLLLAGPALADTAGTISGIVNAVPDVLKLIGLLIATASAICLATPTPDPSTKLGKAYQIIEMLALNWGLAKQTGVNIQAQMQAVQADFRTAQDAAQAKAPDPRA